MGGLPLWLFILSLIAMCIPIRIAWCGASELPAPELVLLTIATLLWVGGFVLISLNCPIGIACIILSGLFAIFALEGEGTI